MMVTNSGRTANGDGLYYTYEDAAKVVGIRYQLVSAAVSSRRITGVRGPNPHRKYVLKDEIDSCSGLGTLSSKEAKLRIAEVRRNRAMAEKEYNVDNTPDWMAESEIKRVLDAHEEMSQQYTELIEHHQELVHRYESLTELVDRIRNLPKKEFIQALVEALP